MQMWPLLRALDPLDTWLPCSFPEFGMEQSPVWLLRAPHPTDPLSAHPQLSVTPPLREGGSGPLRSERNIVPGCWQVVNMLIGSKREEWGDLNPRHTHTRDTGVQTAKRGGAHISVESQWVASASEMVPEDGLEAGERTVFLGEGGRERERSRRERERERDSYDSQVCWTWAGGPLLKTQSC